MRKGKQNKQSGSKLKHLEKEETSSSKKIIGKE